MGESERLFPPGRDHRRPRRRPISLRVDSAVEHDSTDTRAASNLHLLRDCLALGKPDHRPPAKVRLEEALGPELTRKLLRRLSASKRP